ncbi:MAG: hypothetical protein IOD12_18480 [Silvanigrellales bacterium]|nr:hypothetical protein [Silvanigrellales bacterium]
MFTSARLNAPPAALEESDTLEKTSVLPKKDTPTFAGSAYGWAVGAGALVGGVLGWQLFPNREDVVLVEQASAARLVLEAHP